MSLIPSQSSTQEPIIDLEAIENLRALNPDDNGFLKEIIDIFLDDTPARIAELKQTLSAGDIPGFSRAAHSIKGSSSNVGASRLRSVAERLEHGSKSALNGMEPGLRELETEFAAVRSELQKLS
ncbi:MAG TPA: Hpt domain-containing protein [Opitutaceae bacterium]|nr:Hpt domain-containing protein [Opitutaceae bacterium]